MFSLVLQMKIGKIKITLLYTSYMIALYVFFKYYIQRCVLEYVIKKLSIVLGYCTVRKCTCLVFRTHMVLFTYTHNAMEWNLLHTDVHFASFLSGGFTTVAVINPPERKLAKRTPVYWSMVMHFHKGFLHSINLYP